MKKQIYILIFILLSNLAYSQFEMPSIDMKRGERAKLLLTYENVILDSNGFNFKLKFDLNMIDIVNVDVEEKVQNGFGYNYEIIYDQNGSYIDFQGSSTLEGFIAEIEIEALAGPDSITYFRVDSLNGSPYEFDNIISSVIIPDPIIKTENNTLSEPYPNPFSSRFTVDLTINKATSLHAKLFNSGAKLVAIEDNIKGVSVNLVDEANNKVDFGNIEVGSYKIVVEVDPIFFANGYYYLGISLNNEVIYKPILMVN